MCWRYSLLCWPLTCPTEGVRSGSNEAVCGRPGGSALTSVGWKTTSEICRWNDQLRSGESTAIIAHASRGLVGQPLRLLESVIRCTTIPWRRFFERDLLHEELAEFANDLRAMEL